MFGGSEININFPRPIPVHLTYQTAFVDQDGKLQFRDDVYGRDARMIAILKNARERRVAYIPVSVRRTPRPSRCACRSACSRATVPGYGSGPNFFDFLFGARAQQPPAQYYRPRTAASSARAPTTTGAIRGAERQELSKIKNAGGAPRRRFLFGRAPHGAPRRLAADVARPEL